MHARARTEGNEIQLKTVGSLVAFHEGYRAFTIETIWVIHRE